jgi:signal transduction histidine kinase/CheY-like chemotaxis protein
VPRALSTIELDQLPVAILFVEPGGAVVAINTAACRLLGLSRQAALGSFAPRLLQLSAERWQTLCEGIVVPGKAPRRLRRVARPERPGPPARPLSPPRTGQVELVLPRLRLRLQLLVSPATHAGRSLIQIVVLDVTSRALPPIEPAHAADPEQAAQIQRLDSLGLVAGGIAHDFNNLLVGVLAEASAAREDKTLGAGTREALRRIEAAAGRMSRLTKQLLAYAGRGRFVNVRLDPDVMLGDLREQLAGVVKPPATLEVAPGAGAVVVDADPQLLREVVVNLVTNASDAASNRVEVASRLLSRDGTPWWQLEVSDDGAGIDSETIARIFDPFFSTRTDRHGLGLSAVHGIVRRLGGDIEVDSRPGQGARFRVRLPIVPGASASPRPRLETAAPGPRLAGVRILVADDEPSVRATVRRLLERRGATVVVAADGLEAEARLRDERFDLAVLDVTMPGRNGYDVLAFARTAQAALPVILMSGYTAQVRGEGSEEEPDAFIEKPFTAKVLDAAIDDVLAARVPER